MNGYELSRAWFDYCFENTSKITPTHTALYFFIIDHNNRLGWKKEFGLPRQMAMDAIGVKNNRTYTKVFENLEEWGFIIVLERAKNQYSANIIALSNFTPATTKALDKATHKHEQKQIPEQSDSTHSGIVPIDKPKNNKTLEPEKGEPKKKSYRFKPPSQEEACDYFIEKKLHPALAKKEAEKFWAFYNSKNWMVGKNKMKNWKSAITGWINRMDNFKNPNNGNSNANTEPRVNRQTADTIYQNSQSWEIE